MRWKLPRAERERQKALKAVFDTVKNYAHKNEDGKMKGLATLFNISFYLLIALRDIQAVKIDALTHSDEWSRKLYARVILLTIYEWDVGDVTGKTLKDALDLMLIPDDLKRDAIASVRTLRRIREKATKKFYFIRNGVIAHRDPNALVQYRAIRDLDVQDVWDLAIEFFAEVEHFISLLTRLMNAGNTLQSYLRQWSASTKEQDAAKAPRQE